MEETIKNIIYPTLDDSILCAQVLSNGLSHPSAIVLEGDFDKFQLGYMLRQYSEAIKKHKKEVVAGLIKELDKL